MYKRKFILLCLVTLVLQAYAQPTISFTFDDGITEDMPGYTFDKWNDLLLAHLDKGEVKAIFFVTGNNKTDEKGRYLLNSWNDRGHRIANHTFSHPSYNSQATTYEMFKLEFLNNDSIISKYSNYLQLFRFPYLKEGNTKEKIERFRLLLKEHNYKNGHVTVDASDWYINSRLIARLKNDPNADITGFRQFYLKHLYERAVYYEQLAFQLTGRHIKHTLLLHHNLTSALFLGDLIAMFKKKGWGIINAQDAFKDAVFEKQPTNVPAGESLIWALAKESGKFEATLRYPAEDSSYEEDEMDKLGL